MRIMMGREACRISLVGQVLAGQDRRPVFSPQKPSKRQNKSQNPKQTRHGDEPSLVISDSRRVRKPGASRGQ